MRPVKLTLAPVAAVVDAICQAQTVASAIALVLNGTLKVETGVANMRAAAAVVIGCTGDETARTFTITGLNSLSQAISEAVTGVNAGNATSTLSFLQVSKVLVDAATAGAIVVGNADDADGICESQTPALTGVQGLTINGAFADKSVLDMARHISITAVSNESAKTFAVTGKDRNGNALTESLTGPGALATVKSKKNFSEITQILPSAALTGNVQVGTADELEGAAVCTDRLQQGIGYAAYRMTNPNFQYEVFRTQDNILSGAFTEDTARWESYSGGKKDADMESQFTTGAIAALRVAITSFVEGYLDFQVVHPNR